MIILPTTSYYTRKDQLKANKANKFIGRGATGTSTNEYAKAYGTLANCGEYLQSDVVFVSVNGAKRGRLSLDKHEVFRALTAKVTFIADNPYNRNRSYNVGERELENLLLENDYKEFPQTNYSVWIPKSY